MKNSIGTSVILTVFGESHGEEIGCVLDGLAPGLEVDDEFIKAQLAKRRPQGLTDTARVENDDYKIISGVKNGFTTGAPICILIPNENVRSSDYDKNYGIARPSHADYAAHVKYHGFEDYRGGGHFSGRITAGIVAAGAICLQTLNKKGIQIGTHILQCGSVKEQSFSNFEKEIPELNKKNFPVISDIEEKMTEEILKYKMEGNSIGGKIETAIIGVPSGLGEPWFDSLEGQISKAMFAIGGIKGIEFGAGFDFADLSGEEANDSFIYNGEKVETLTNNNGGINGGISNGMPIVFKLAVKPTPSISKPQKTIDFISKKDSVLELVGRHDPAIIRRICIVVSSLTAIILADELEKRYGVDYLATKEDK